MYFVGIDIGTSSVCGVVYNKVTNELFSLTRENDAAMVSACGWEKMQDTDRIIGIVTDILNSFLSKYPDIKGIGITGQMHGMLYVDAGGSAVSPLYTWQDGRGNCIFKEGKTYAGYLSERSGYPLASGYGLVTHFYNKENGLVPDSAVKLCTIMDYAVMWLSGRKAPLIDYTNGASLGLFDLKSLGFDFCALEAAGIDCSVLPELAESATLAGYFSGIPVYSAIGDNQAAFLGSVSDTEKSVHVTVGTSSQLSVYSKNFIKTDNLDTRPFPGGGYLLVGAALCGGQSFRILKTFFENTLRLFGGKSAANDINLYDVMTAVDFEELSDNRPVVDTLFDGSRTDPVRRGAISNISVSNLTPENLVLGFVEGIARELYGFYEQIPEAIIAEKKLLVGSGNGVRKNSLLRKAFEKQFGYPLTVSQCEEEAAFGAALCAVRQG